ncbi:MAG: DUF3465 domain-containing protein [Planctomycetes bacterium]|nr:DUF3465 domain-containing protein [Planctomycetota bacterium]
MAIALVVAVALAKWLLGGEDASSRGDVAKTAARGSTATATELARSADALYTAIRDHRSSEWVEGSARVVKNLPDDKDGDRHQRFLAELDDGSSLLFAHNIDVAPRAPVEKGDVIRFRGRYEWNDKGGVVHWTHHDDRDPARGGWLRLGDDVFE